MNNSSHDDIPNTHNAFEDDILLFADEDDESLFFAEEDDEFISEDAWKVLIVDDEPQVHAVTRLALNEFSFDNKPLELISAYSGEEARQRIAEHTDVALILLDVVMETDDAGLSFAKYVRHHIKNQFARIVLRTGQPGQAPEETVILDYDINDYKAKTELTTQKLFTTIVTALRTFDALVMLENHRQELERIAKASARFVPTEFLTVLRKSSIVDVELGDQVQATMTIMFADVRSFTTLSEQMTPKENFEFINQLLGQLGPIVRQYQGFIDKYIGDGIMALFPSHPDSALSAAIETQQVLQSYNARRAKENLFPIRLGCGLHTGNMILGVIGEAERIDGTVISDTVNTASRLESMTKTFGATIIISGEMLAQITRAHQHRFLGKVRVKGKQTPVMLYEILDGESEAQAQLKAQTAVLFQDGVTHYQNKSFAQAEKQFNAVLAENPDDQAAHFYLKQMTIYQALPQDDKWEGLINFNW